MAVRPLDSSTGAVLVLALPAQKHPGALKAQIYAAFPVQTGSSFLPYKRSEPLIFCDLSDEELRRVEHGLPPGLEEAFRRKVQALGAGPLHVEASRVLFGDVEEIDETNTMPAVKVLFEDYK